MVFHLKGGASTDYALKGQEGEAVSRVERETIRRISYRLIPFLCLAYFFMYLDRVNVGFAALQMNEDLGFSSLVYAWGAGIFFIGYFIFEVPSNVAFTRFGARRWIARIMVTWGLLSASMALVSGPTSFYVLRFLLGVAEAGFFPALLLYMPTWYPAAYRARIMAALIVTVPVSTVIGAPVSGLILGLDGVWGLHGWQWLFIIEGLPASVLGVVAYFYLSDRPKEASWLTAEQKAWLTARLAEEEAKRPPSTMTLFQALRSPLVLILSVVYFGVIAVLYGMQFWLPQIVKDFGLSDAQTGFAMAGPYFIAAVAMILWGRRSDRRRERVKHIAVPMFVAGAGLAASALLPGAFATMLAITVVAIGVFCTLAVFWTLPTALLSGAAATGGLALINSIGNLAGFGGPYLVGWIAQRTGDPANGLFLLAVSPVISGLIVLWLGRRAGTKS